MNLVASSSIALLLSGAPAPMTMDGTVARGDVALWYQIRGAGKGVPLVVINGGPGFSHDYLTISDDVWDALAAKRRVVFYDQRGVGKSSPLPKDKGPKVRDQVEDLEALRAALGVEKLDLLGHSFGGYIAMAYAVRYPERVAHLLVVSSATPKWTDGGWLWRYFYPETETERGRLAFLEEGFDDPRATDEGLRQYFHMLFASPEKRDWFQKHAKRDWYNSAINEALHGELAGLDMWPALASLRTPTLVMCGRFDFNHPPSTAWQIHKAISGSQWHVFERSGHMPFFEQPDEFRAVVEKFLAR